MGNLSEGLYKGQAMPAYSFQDRLAHINRRMKEINAEVFTYIRTNPMISQPVTVSPVLHKAMESDSYAPSLYRVEMECFGIDVVDLTEAGVWPPKDQDILRRANGEEFRVSKPSEN